jgi:pimeloyl-ACP methyl ester carboxylesterase
MFYNAKNCSLEIDNTTMDYISFGHGDKNLVMILGLSDGLKTVKGSAVPFATMYGKYAKEYKVYVFSQKNTLTEGYSTRDMAKDIAHAMKILGISKADVMGVSQGGMIAQYVAIDFPHMVDRLVLVVTLSKQNETIHSVVDSRIDMAKLGDYKHLMIDTFEKMFTENYLKKYRWLYPILGRVGKPKSFDRFIVMANACTMHNSYDELYKIKSPTLVIGGDSDRVVGKDTSQEIAKQIHGSKLLIYEGLGHGVYEEAKDFNQQVISFLTR